MGAHYGRVLEVAIRAAQAAGAILRAEFHQAGGAKSETGKAAVDVQAEQAIRTQLLGAFPHWGYHGQQTGEQDGAADEPHCWLVDPNNGGAAYQKGYRGTAVSIGLLRDGRPVLGVVYAFAAPDDAGDLLAWAEGCGPLRRNGEPVVREPWPTAIGRNDIVLLDHGAERKPAAVRAAVGSGRYRTLPSVAYRLALAAAGEAVAAVALNAPIGSDYGAGHALLCSAGGELLDERGQPVTYSRTGSSRANFCFGGGPQIVAGLAARNWQDFLQTPQEPFGDYGLVTLEPGRNVPDAGLLERAQGCLLGQVAGDSLGSLVEFETKAEIAGKYPSGLRRLADDGYWDTMAGQPTDDSELALMLARSLVQAGKYDAEAAVRAYHYWYRTKPFDCGVATGQALSSITRSDLAAGAAAAKARKSASVETQANGSLMRLSPMGIWGHRLPERVLAEHARADASLTHPHAVCRDAAAAFAIAVAHGIATGAEPQAVYERAVTWVNAQAWEASVRRAVTDAAHRPPADYKKSEGWVLIALQNAFYQLVNAPSLEEGVVRTVMAGGDTDTNAAIAGALLGAVAGRAAVPWQWRQMVLTCRPMEGLPGVKRPRSRAFWPVDALELAERLLVCGQAAG